MLLAFTAWFVFFAPPLKLSSDEPITIDIVEPAPKSAQIDNRTKTVVQPTDGQETDQAKQDSYLSDKNRVVKEETIAKNSGIILAGKPAASQISMLPKPKAASAKSVKLSDLGVKLSAPKKEESFEKDRNWAESQTGEAIHGGDYVQGIKEGEASALNTKEFVFYSYFARVRRQLDSTWQPLLRQQIGKVRRKGRNLASNTDYVTRTVVTLDAKGSVLRVQLLEESGTTDLDKAAIDALNNAGPYPNPPKGLVDDSGQVQIRWDFILKT